ncbi:gamma-type small acid-soluble spore protein [Lysinibacillus telephonicus]|uniref:Gamma-type small acid-soluble spore protein n=1 Tax=Lysinibacillus telephonicus TaxID=1714840 RepID=A0A431USR6_9BACI|nr:gamma-type small acid-soluble spore protein [Lysinibacillus telephonicus]RTQ93536.1 gamma-type small acid-soluble spore protein [Lysinibacillus telephonicus]
MEQGKKQFTVAGTDIEEVKRKNAQSGLSYKEVLEMLAKRGGHNTAQFSDTNSEEIKRKIQPPLN